MKRELEKKIVDDFPYMFKDMYGDPMKTCLAWGFECGDGWYQLLYDLCEQIAEVDIEQTVHVSQVKEKFAGVRFYFHGGDDAVDKLVTAAEERSYKTCETCGTTENVTTNERGWLSTLCNDCRQPSEPNQPRGDTTFLELMTGKKPKEESE